MGASLSSFYPASAESMNIIEISEEVYDRVKFDLEEEPKNDLAPKTEKPADKTVENQNIIKTLPVEYHQLANYDMDDEIEPSTFKENKKSELDEDEKDWHRNISDLEQNLNRNIPSDNTTTNIDLKKKNSRNVLFGFRKTNPCKILEKKLIACYRANSGFTLTCESAAKAFIACVSDELTRSDAETAELGEEDDDDDDDDDDD